MDGGSGRLCSRRDALAALGSAAVGGVAGCSVLPGPTGIAIELPDGTRVCVEPVQRDRPVADFYGYERRRVRPNRAHGPPLLVEGGTVTFLYRNESTGALSLCVVHGSPGRGQYGGGRAIVTFEGVDGTGWQVRDDPPGADGSNDAYDTSAGTLGASETVLWKWPDDETDGGAVGHLGEEFDVQITHRSGATVGGDRVERTGLDRWLFLDGEDPRTPIELARFDRQDERDPSIRLFVGTC